MRSRTAQILLVALGVIVLASFLPLWVTGYVLGLLTIAYYFGVFAMSWDLLFGFAGEVNFGPTFLIGTGAYTAGILDNLYQPPIWVCVAAGARALFRTDHAGRRAHAAKFHCGRREPDRRRDRPHRARRDHDQRCQEL